MIEETPTLTNYLLACQAKLSPAEILEGIKKQMPGSAMVTGCRSEVVGYGLTFNGQFREMVLSTEDTNTFDIIVDRARQKFVELSKTPVDSLRISRAIAQCQGKGEAPQW